MRKTSLYRQPLGNPMPIAELITPNQVRLLPQSTGEQQGDRILVESGLKADESFVIAGTHKLRDGAVVRD